MIHFIIFILFIVLFDFPYLISYNNELKRERLISKKELLILNWGITYIYLPNFSKYIPI